MSDEPMNPETAIVVAVIKFPDNVVSANSADIRFTICCDGTLRWFVCDDDYNPIADCVPLGCFSAAFACALRVFNVQPRLDAAPRMSR